MKNDPLFKYVSVAVIAALVIAFGSSSHALTPNAPPPETTLAR